MRRDQEYKQSLKKESNDKPRNAEKIQDEESFGEGWKPTVSLKSTAANFI